MTETLKPLRSSGSTTRAKPWSAARPESTRHLMSHRLKGALTGLHGIEAKDPGVYVGEVHPLVRGASPVVGQPNGVTWMVEMAGTPRPPTS